jgi:serine/threonine protein kinase
MDMWGYGCVFFEMMCLFPLFPGKDEPDQVNKIHNILGTPPRELLEKFKKFSKHMDFNFPAKEGTGIANLSKHMSPECIDLIERLLAYNPDDRLSAKQALRHPFFQDLYENDKRMQMNTGPSSTLRGTHNEIHSDNQSENPNNMSHGSNNPINGLTININNSSSNQNMNINLNLNKKKGLLPDIRKGNNTYQDESDPDHKYDPKKPYNQLVYSKKYSKYPIVGGQELVPGGQNYIALKKISDKKKSYISPYSQKAIVTTHKPY